MLGALALGSQLLAVTMAVPPPVPQTQANCAAPVYASDQLVCRDQRLLALDRRTAKLANAIGDERLVAAGLESQAEWFRKRSLCAMQTTHRQCLNKAYEARTRELKRLR